MSDHPATRRIRAAANVRDYYATVGMADAIGLGDRDAVLLWLRNSTSTPEVRVKLAADIMRRSVFTQAVLLEVVDCAACAWPLSDGCELCTRRDGSRRIPW